jgi:hypothetical protein
METKPTNETGPEKKSNPLYDVAPEMLQRLKDNTQVFESWVKRAEQFNDSAAESLRGTIKLNKDVIAKAEGRP